MAFRFLGFVLVICLILLVIDIFVRIFSTNEKRIRDIVCDEIIDYMYDMNDEEYDIIEYEEDDIL